ncbi:transposase, partial [Brevibacterium epidermidis]
WLARQSKDFRDGIEVVGMDGFTGFKTAAVEELPAAVEVMDPFHVVKLAGDSLDEVRRRVQQETTGHRGKKGDPLYQARRTLHTGCQLLTERQQQRIVALFADDKHADVEVTWSVFQDIITAYRNLDRTAGKKSLQSIIESISSGVPSGLVELRRLGRTLKKRAVDVLAYFDRPGTSNGPTEGLNGRLEHLRGSALGFRNLTHYIARSLLEAGGFRPRLHP